MNGCQAFQGAWAVAVALAKFNRRMVAALVQKKMQDKKNVWQGDCGRDEVRSGMTGEGREGRGSREERSATPSTVGWGVGVGQAAAGVPVGSLSIEGMEKLSAFAVQQQLQRMEEERAEMELQVGCSNYHGGGGGGGDEHNSGHNNNNDDYNNSNNNNICIIEMMGNTSSNSEPGASAAHAIRRSPPLLPEQVVIPAQRHFPV